LSGKNVWSELLNFCIQNPDLKYVMINAIIVFAHTCAAGYGDQVSKGLVRSRGGFSSKIHAKVDAPGNPLQFIISACRTSEITQAKGVLDDVYHSYVTTDRTYGSSEIRK
jgi:hypothetical protein